MSDRQEGSGWWLASDGKWYPPESHPSVRSGGGEVPADVRYAGFWLRVWATLIDAVITTIALGIATGILGIDGGGLFGDGSFSSSGFILDTGAVWLYSALMESSSLQATIGKMALSIKVTDLSGERVTFGKATGRHFGKFVSGVILFIGFMMAGWTVKKQALHDMMAGTLVVKS